MAGMRTGTTAQKTMTSPGVTVPPPVVYAAALAIAWLLQRELPLPVIPESVALWGGRCARGRGSGDRGAVRRGAVARAWHAEYERSVGRARDHGRLPLEPQPNVCRAGAGVYRCRGVSESPVGPRAAPAAARVYADDGDRARGAVSGRRFRAAIHGVYGARSPLAVSGVPGRPPLAAIIGTVLEILKNTEEADHDHNGCEQ
jgi:hypothetical protein